MRNRVLVLATAALMAVSACSGGSATPTAPPAPVATPASQTPAPTAAPTASPTTSAATPEPTPSAPSPSGVATSPSGAPGTSGSPASSPGTGGSPGADGPITVGDAANVAPITEAVVAQLAATNPGVTATLQTSEDFADFCAGKLDAYGSVRKIKPKGEASVCAANKVDYLQLEIALDAVAIVTSAQNNAIDCLGYPELYALLGPESTGIANWKDANALATAVGSFAGFSDAPLAIAGLPPDSPTSQYLLERAIAPIAAKRSKDAALRTDYQVLTDVAAISQTVVGTDPAASNLGWMGVPDATRNAAQVKTLRIDGGDGCVEATPDKIVSGAYPMSRPLYLYVNTGAAATKPALVSFVDFYLADGTLSGVLQSLPYLPLPDDVLLESRFEWQGR